MRIEAERQRWPSAGVADLIAITSRPS